MGSRPSPFTPDVQRYLLKDEGEQIIDEVVKHPICMVVPTLTVIVGALIMMTSPVARQAWLIVLIVGLAIALVGLWKVHVRAMDRFVITNMRVFRVHGVINRYVATMPLTRILDIAVRQPLLGMIFNYGHFTFESAADDQGLRVITFVGDPKRRDTTIQRVIQRAGIRAVVQPDDDGTA
jgi:uncharacterized membrane protein YdbT with pleckstrin-like domain